MKTITRLLALILLMSTVGLSASARQVKVMTYNVHNGIGLDKIRDHQRIADIIKLESPDFVAIQEVDSATNRSGNQYVLGDIAQKAGMEAIFAPAIPWDGGIYGIGILSKEKPLSVTRLPLPGREENRTLLIARFNDFTIVDTHLSLTPADALASVEIISDALKADADKPVILMGDLNSLPDSPVIKALSSIFQIVNPESPSFPANAPTERIDYIMVSNAFPVTVNRAEVLDEKVASDHRPIVADLTF